MHVEDFIRLAWRIATEVVNILDNLVGSGSSIRGITTKLRMCYVCGMICILFDKAMPHEPSYLCAIYGVLLAPSLQLKYLSKEGALQFMGNAI